METEEGRRDCRASSMARPERRMGTMLMCEGEMSSVVYS